MQMNQNTGKYVILIGVVVVIIGTIIYLFNEKLQWLGRLPGDIRVEKENLKFFFPVTTMIILSVILNLIVWIVRKIL